MAFTTETSLDVVATQMAKHATAAVKEAIKNKIRAEADLIIEQVAKELADNVVAQLDRFVEPVMGNVNLVLRINNREVER